MPLPPPFTKSKRLPDMRAFVAKSDTEFTYFIREDSPLREGYHKDLHKLVQLMRCALRLQILHMVPSNQARTIYCFGYLTSGYKMQLVKMEVMLFSKEDYNSPLYTLQAEKELDLSNFEAEPLETLMTQLAAIRHYGRVLESQLEEWTLVKKP